MLRIQPSTLSTKLGGIFFKKGFLAGKSIPLTKSLCRRNPSSLSFICIGSQDHFSAEGDPVRSQILLLEDCGVTHHLSPCMVFDISLFFRVLFDKLKAHRRGTNRNVHVSHLIPWCSHATTLTPPLYSVCLSIIPTVLYKCGSSQSFSLITQGGSVLSPGL